MSNPDPDDFEPLYKKGVVNPRRQLFATISLRWGEADVAAIGQVAARLGHPASYVDTDGYEIEITAAAVHQELDRLAWVISRAKELDTHPLTGKPDHYIDISFHLCAMVDGKVVINWEPYTYNPYFGCDVSHIEWHGDYVVIVYREKHDTYVAAANTDGSVKYVKIGHRWGIHENTVGHMDWFQPQVNRLTIPDLEVLSPLTEDEAKEAGFFIEGD